MSRQLELVQEERVTRRNAAVGRAVEYGIEGALAHAGAELRGLTIKIQPNDCLVVVKVILGGRQQVAFVGGIDMSSCLLKLVDEAKRDALRWKPDRFAQQGVDK